MYRKNGRQKYRVGVRTAEFSSSMEVKRKCLKLKYPRRAIQAFVNNFTAMMVNETYQLKTLKCLLLGSNVFHNNLYNSLTPNDCTYKHNKNEN